MNFQPIETFYKNCKFRSRQEARWAVFFDELSVKWEYEVEGFELPPYKFNKKQFLENHMNDVKDSKEEIDSLNLIADYLVSQASKSLRFLPDFWLEEFDLWAEVKHKSRMKSNFLKDYEKLMRFVNYSGKPILLCTKLEEFCVLISNNKTMGNITYNKFSFTNDEDLFNKSVKKALSKHFEFNN